jgi:ADP-heptose:LPS heptosyltransferase
MVQARAILTVDNDLSHLAAALETPTICLLSSDSDKQTSAIGSKLIKLTIEESNQEDYSPVRLQQLVNELIHQHSTVKFSRHSMSHKNSA